MVTIHNLSEYQLYMVKTYKILRLYINIPNRERREETEKGQKCTYGLSRLGSFHLYVFRMSEVPSTILTN